MDAVPERDRQEPAALCAVCNEKQPVFFAERSDLPVRQDLSGDIADERADDRTGLRADQPAERCNGFVSVCGNRRDAVRDHMLLSHGGDGSCNGIVLHTAEDDVVALPERPADREVQRMCAVLREDHMLRLCIKERGRRFPRAIDHPACPCGQRMPAASGIAAVGFRGTPQRFQHRTRLWKCCGGIVKIYDSVHRCGSFLPSVRPVRDAAGRQQCKHCIRSAENPEMIGTAGGGRDPVHPEAVAVSLQQLPCLFRVGFGHHDKMCFHGFTSLRYHMQFRQNLTRRPYSMLYKKQRKKNAE